MAGGFIRRVLASVRRPSPHRRAQASLGAEAQSAKAAACAVDETRGSKPSLYEVIFERAPIGMALLGAAGRPLELNAALRAMLKGDEGELRQLRFSDVLQCDAESMDATFRDLIQGRIDQFSGDMRLRRRDGTEFHGRATVAVVRPPDAPPQLIGTLEDITERRRLEEKLRQAQKMEAVGLLAGGIAHDFNNLLTVIYGHAEAMADAAGGAASSPAGDPRANADAIRAAADRAASLTRQLLAFSRQQQLTLQPVDLNEVVGGVSTLLRRVIGDGIRLDLHLDPIIPHVRADLAQLEHVLMNLAVNARDAMPRGGTLTIETTTTQLDEAYAGGHVEVTPGTYAMLSVSDTGTGMDRQTRARVFEPFFTTKGEGRGMGLGLSTVYGIVKQFGGSVWVYSELGHGTTFKVYLPVAEPTTTTEVTGLTPVLRGASETVLLVEDEDAVRGLLASTLRREGYLVLEAANGMDAIAVAATHHSPIQIMVSDVVMPGMSGPDLYDRLVVQRPDLKVLFISGYADHAVLNLELLKTGNAFLGKPFTRGDLLNRVRLLIDAEIAAE
jgi:PAS domain S-box-containing protein